MTTTITTTSCTTIARDCSPIIDIDHEDGTESEYDSFDGLVNPASALAGTNYGSLYEMTVESYGMKVMDSSSTEGKLNTRLYIDTRNAYYEDSSAYTILQLKSDIFEYIGRIEISLITGFVYPGFIRAHTIKDDGGIPILSTPQYQLTDNEHYIEHYIVRETYDGAEDGKFYFYIDGVEKYKNDAVQNYNTFSNFSELKIGVMDRFMTNESGAIYIDEIVVNDIGEYIGPV